MQLQSSFSHTHLIYLIYHAHVTKSLKYFVTIPCLALDPDICYIEDTNIFFAFLQNSFFNYVCN